MMGYGAPGVPGVPGAPIGQRTTQAVTHAVWHYALLFGLLSGLFAALQVAFSSWAAIANQPAIASLYYGLRNGTFAPNTVIRWLTPVAIAAYGTCLLGFVVSLWLCWHAGRAAAWASGRWSVGAGAGLLTSAIGSVVWLISSIVVVVVLHTDGSITGMLATTPDRSGVNLGGELAGRSGALSIQRLAIGPHPGPGLPMPPMPPAPPAWYYPRYAGGPIVQPGGPPAAPGWPVGYPGGPPAYPPLPGVYRTPPVPPGSSPGVPPGGPPPVSDGGVP
jgi:hypothetical protein